MKNLKYDDLKIALEESLKLQAHYAKILNIYDGGKRMIFNSLEDWIKRLEETGTISNEKEPNKRG